MQISNIMYNKRTSNVQQKISYWRSSLEFFFIVSMYLQRLKFLRNTRDGVKLSHFNKVTFSTKKAIKGVYSLQILFKEIFNGYWKGYFSRSIRKHKLSNFFYSIIFNWTSWLLNKVTKVSCNDDSLLGIFGEVSGRDYISWKFRFPNYIHFDLDSCSKNKDSCLGLIFEKTYGGLLFS